MAADIETRVVRFLARGPAMMRESATAGKVLLDGGDRGAIAVPGTVLEDVARRDLVKLKDDAVELTPSGIAHGRRSLAATDPFQEQHRELAAVTVDLEAGRETAISNDAESPLRLIARRKDRTGKCFLSVREVEAGERLRSDYTRGQLMPRLGANWQAAVSSGRRADGNGIADLTDAALAARLRVEKAIEAVGPELSGVLVDICCFLKGLEQVEMEHGWPARSAKVVLKAALAALGRHYEPPARKPQNGRRPILHWGAENYRPSLPG